MPSIDRADYHVGNVKSPNNFTIVKCGTHIGMYLTWIIDNDFMLKEDYLEYHLSRIKRVRSRQMTGRDFLFDHLDGKFIEDLLNEEGLAFTTYYYENRNERHYCHDEYLDDYKAALGYQYNSIYDVPNSWENYEIISKIIDKRYEDWKILPK